MADVRETDLREEKVNWGDTPPTETISRDQIVAELAKGTDPEEPVTQTPAQAPAPVEQPVKQIQPVQPSGQEQTTGINSTAVATPPIEGQPPKSAEQAPALNESQIKEFLDKKHVPPQDTWKVVKMYQDAQKALTQKSMEVADLKKNVLPGQPVMQVPVQQPAVSPITGLPYSNSDPNAQLLEDLQQNPILTLRKVAEVAYGTQVNQLAESMNEQKLHNTIVRLSTSPDTAEFNLPLVQEEIKAVMNERPDLSGNLEANLPMLNDLAIGRLYRAGKLNKDAVEAGKKIAEQNLASRQAATMESANKQTPVVEKPFEQSGVNEMADYFKKLGFPVKG